MGGRGVYPERRKAVVGKVIRCGSYDELSDTTFDLVEASITTTLKEKETFCMAIPGGRSPRGLFSRMADATLSWEKIHIFFTDERMVPPESTDSNYALASSLLLDRISIPGGNVHRIRGELKAEEAASEYDVLLRKVLPDGVFDLILLGLGSDCHIASLFPLSETLKETQRWAVAVRNTPIADRVTITVPVIMRAKKVILIVSGCEKEVALKKLLNEDTEAKECPGRIVLRHPDATIVYALS